MFRSVLAPPVLAMLLLFAACGGEDESSQPTPATESATPIASASPTPSSTEGANPSAVARQPLAVFVRGVDYPFESVGELWISRLDGSGAMQITNDGAVAKYAGVAEGKDSGLLVHYAVLSGDEPGIWVYDTAMQSRSLILGGEDITSASISPTYRYIAFAQDGHLNLLDLTSGQVSRLRDGGDRELCPEVTIAECRSFGATLWSPDGSLIAAYEGLWEGGRVHIVDPLAPKKEIGQAGRIRSGGWSPGSDSLCTYSRYDAPSALALNSLPGWETELFFSEYEESLEGTSVEGCQWPQVGEVVVLTSRLYEPPNISKLVLLDVESGDVTEIASFDDSDICCTRHMVLFPDGGHLVTQGFDYLADAPAATQPRVVDIETGELSDVLERGDYVVDVIR